MKALILVPSPKDPQLLRLAEALARFGTDIVTNEEGASALRQANILCSVTGRATGLVDITFFDFVVLGMPDVLSNPFVIPEDDESAERCSLLTRAASHYETLAVVSDESVYCKVVEGLAEQARAGCDGASVSVPLRLSLREELAEHAFRVASIWTSHAARCLRRKEKPARAALNGHSFAPA